ncbi:hypothetical protein HDU76_010919 [Blyttiomyces sp. JEL0837]|nr:hypothetical protein HDU76_010919 [Blyttiomyces sp. JEL0837]
MSLMKPAFVSDRADLMMGTWNQLEVVVKRAMNQAVLSTDIKTLKAEVEAIKKLDHENLLKVFGVCLVPPNISIVSEFVSTGNLYDLVRDGEVELEVEETLRLAIQVCEGMVFLHQQTPTCYHLNLHSRNVLLTADRTVKLSEYGYKDSIFSRLRLYRESVELGNFNTSAKREEVEWMAPEILEGKIVKNLAAVDSYAFGILLYEIVSRDSPFPDMDAAKVVEMVVTEAEMPTIPDFVPDDLKDLMVSCWSRPDQRPNFSTLKSKLADFSLAMDSSEAQ